MGNGTELMLPVTMEDNSLMVCCAAQNAGRKTYSSAVLLTVLPGQETDVVDDVEEETPDVSEVTLNTCLSLTQKHFDAVFSEKSVLSEKRQQKKAWRKRTTVRTIGKRRG